MKHMPNMCYCCRHFASVRFVVIIFAIVIVEHDHWVAGVCMWNGAHIYAQCSYMRLSNIAMYSLLGCICGTRSHVGSSNIIAVMVEDCRLSAFARHPLQPYVYYSALRNSRDKERDFEIYIVDVKKPPQFYCIGKYRLFACVSNLRAKILKPILVERK